MVFATSFLPLLPDRHELKTSSATCLTMTCTDSRNLELVKSNNKGLKPLRKWPKISLHSSREFVFDFPIIPIIFDILIIPFSGVPIYPNGLKPVLTDIIWYFSISTIFKFVCVECKLHVKQSLSITYILFSHKMSLLLFWRWIQWSINIKRMEGIKWFRFKEYKTNWL